MDALRNIGLALCAVIILLIGREVWIARTATPTTTVPGKEAWRDGIPVKDARSCTPDMPKWECGIPVK